MSGLVNVLWNRYNLHIDLYKFYLTLVIKANAFYYGLLTAVLSLNTLGSSLTLLIPAVLGIVIGVIGVVGANYLSNSEKDIKQLSERLSMEFKVETKNLRYLMYTLSVVMLLTSLLLTVVVWQQNLLTVVAGLLGL